MKVISFSEPRFVRAILEGKKTQTIRPLFREKLIEDHKVMEGFSIGGAEPKTTGKMMKVLLNKEPRFKVGEKAKLMFKQRSTPKDSWFCLDCGSILEVKRPLTKDSVGVPIIKREYWYCKNHGERNPHTNVFPKHFATVRINDVFEIEMGETRKGKYLGFVHKEDALKHAKSLFRMNNTYCYNGIMTEFAIADGFIQHNNQSPWAMLEWFHKQYNLDQPKRFAVYGWTT